MNPAPGFKKYPKHRVETKASDAHLRVTLKGGPQNAVWSYESPYDELMAIKEALAFYPDKVEVAVKRAGA